MYYIDTKVRGYGTDSEDLLHCCRVLEKATVIMSEQ